MVQDFEFYQDGKLKHFTYSNGEIKLMIMVNSFESVYAMKSEEKTIGKVFEVYRDKRRTNPLEAEGYFDSKISICNNFLANLSSSAKTYDYVQVMFPSDERRKRILTQFSNRICGNNNDFSNCFVKRQDLSVTEFTTEEEAVNNFSYTKPAIKEIPKTIHIVDDTISSGRTINIFLDNLNESNLLTNDTKITASIIYNNYKANTPNYSLAEILKARNS